MNKFGVRGPIQYGFEPVVQKDMDFDEDGVFCVDNEKFVDGKLTATGCFDRHNTPRATWYSNTPDDLFGRPAMSEEMRLLSTVHYLLSLGKRIRKHKSISERLETFVRRHQDIKQED